MSVDRPDRRVFLKRGAALSSRARHPRGYRIRAGSPNGEGAVPGDPGLFK